MSEYKYIIRRKDNKIIGEGFISAEENELQYVTDVLPEGATWVEPEKPKREQIQELFKTMPLPVRAQLMSVATGIDAALGVDDIELAMYLVLGIPDGDYVAVKNAVLEILGR